MLNTYFYEYHFRINFLYKKLKKKHKKHKKQKENHKKIEMLLIINIKSKNNLKPTIEHGISKKANIQIQNDARMYGHSRFFFQNT